MLNVFFSPALTVTHCFSVWWPDAEISTWYLPGSSSMPWTNFGFMLRMRMEAWLGVGSMKRRPCFCGVPIFIVDEDEKIRKVRPGPRNRRADGRFFFLTTVLRERKLYGIDRGYA